MSIPNFPETNHPLVKSLSHYSDQELLTLFQNYPTSGQYFVAIFCRYSTMIYMLIRHSARSLVQVDYLFFHIWRHVFFEMGGLDLSTIEPSHRPPATLQSWLIKVAAQWVNQVELPPVEAIHYNLQAASPPFQFYVEQALEQLPPLARFVILMAQTFNWSEARIAAYLQAEGETLTPTQIKEQLQVGYQLLETTLPEDICEIYLNRRPILSDGLEELFLEPSMD